MARQTLDFSRFDHDDLQPLDNGLSSLSLGQEIAALPFLLEDFTGIATWRGKPIWGGRSAAESSPASR